MFVAQTWKWAKIWIFSVLKVLESWLFSHCILFKYDKWYISRSMSALLSTLKFHTHSYWFHSGPHLQNYQRLWSVVDSPMLLIFPSFPNTTVTFLVSIHMGHKYLIIFIHSESSINTIFLKFSCYFQSFSFNVHEHPAKPLATATELVYSYTPAPFSFQIEWPTRCEAQSSAH